MVLYRIFICCAVPLLAIIGLWRVLRGRETWEDYTQRLGLSRRAPKNETDHIWVHAASNGELTAVLPVLDALSKACPALRVCVTTNSTSARSLAQEKDYAAYLAPFDTRWAARRLIQDHAIIAHITTEAEIWPNRLASLKASGLPCVLISGRMRPKTAQIWQKFITLAREAFGTFVLVSAQDEYSQANLANLGTNQTALAAPINLKAYYQPASIGHLLPELPYNRSTTWLAASTHPGEEEIVLAAHQNLLKKSPQWRLILAPRHPRRTDEVAQLIQTMGLSYSTLTAGEPSDCDVLLVDRLGIMQHLYPKAIACFIAGSFVGVGGHTPFEPMYFGTALLHGPFYHNFKEIYEDLDRAGAAFEVTNADTLAEQLHEMSSTRHQEEVVSRARKFQPDAQEFATLIRQILRVLPKT